MAIYRGPGGSGDATQDAASEVLLALAAKDAAIAAQVAAETAQTNAETAETNAETAETNAEAAAALAATFNPALYVAKANNLSDLASSSTARTNLGLVIGTDVLSPSGSGASLTALNATNISSGTLGAARLPAFSGDATSTIGTSALTLATVNSNTGSFGSSSAVPVITVNGKGLITAVTTAAVSGSISVTGGDLTLSGDTGTAITNATLATVNSNTGSFGSSSSIPVITVNGKGLITAVTTSAVAGGQYFGSAATKAIAYNSTTIAENITTTSGNNCLSVGPITINSGFTVTIASGQRWVVL